MTRNVNIGEMPILQTRDSQQMIDEIVGMLSQGRQPLQQIAEPNRPAPTQEKPMSFHKLLNKLGLLERMCLNGMERNIPLR